MDSCRTSRGTSQPPVHAGMGTASGFNAFTLVRGGRRATIPPFPGPASPSHSVKTPTTEIHFIAAHFSMPLHDRKYQTKAPSPCSQIPVLSPAGRGNAGLGHAELSTAASQTRQPQSTVRWKSGCDRAGISSFQGSDPQRVSKKENREKKKSLSVRVKLSPCRSHYFSFATSFLSGPCGRWDSWYLPQLWDSPSFPHALNTPQITAWMSVRPVAAARRLRHVPAQDCLCAGLD